MKVFPVVIADDSYFDLFSLFETSIRKLPYPFEPTRFYVPPEVVFGGAKLDFLKKHGVIHKTRPNGYGWWGDWRCPESYLAVFKDLAAENAIQNDDYVMDADADVVMVRTKVLDQIDGSDVIAIKCYGDGRDIPQLGATKWIHYSGCFIFFKGSFVRKIASASQDVIAKVKKVMSEHDFPILDDVFVSVLTLALKGTVKYLTFHETVVSNPESVILGKTTSDASVVHWQGDEGTWKSFLGVPVTGKKDLPRAIRESGVNFP